MELITGAKLHAMVDENPRLFAEILPELVKRLILSGCKNVKHIRIPSLDDIWAPGFDGVVECEEGTRFVNTGFSIWEFGTNNDSLAKINADYDKRTKDPKGLNMSQTSFYLVTPRIWAFDKYKSITEWESGKSEWKSIRIYDAVILAEWINAEPAVCSWLLEKVHNTTGLGFSTVNCAWDTLSHKTDPAFTTKMFLIGREREVEVFSDSITRNIIRIKADTFIESVGFALSALLQNADYAERTIVINNSETYRMLSSCCKYKVFLLNYKTESDIIKSENTVIICYNKEATSVIDCLELPQLSKSQYETALNDMGITSADIHKLYAFTHGNIRALIRRIPGLSTEKAPDWTTENDIILLAPLLFLGSFCIDTDRDLVEMLSGIKYETVEKKYIDLLRFEDSPIKKTDKYYTIVDYENTFFALNIQPSDSSFQRLRSTIISILSALAEKGSWNERSFLDYGLHRLIHALIYNLVYFSYEHQATEELATTVEEILPFVYNEKTSKVLLDNLHLLAEAEPESVMGFLDLALGSADSRLLDLCSADPYDSRYCFVLSALDELVLHDQTAIRSCNALFKLYLLDKKYTLGNTPENSLQTAMNFWNNRGELKLIQKKELFLSFIKKEPQKGSELFASVISARSFFRSERLGAKELPVEPITYAEVFSAIEEVGSIVFDYAINNCNGKLIGKLLESYYLYPPEFLVKFAEKVKPDAFDEDSLLSVNYTLRRVVFHIQKYNWDNKKPYLASLIGWIRHTTPSNPALASMWAFTKYYECFALELLPGSDDIIGNTKATEEYRIKTLTELVEQYGILAGLQIVERLDDDSNWGCILLRVFENDSLKKLADDLTSRHKYRILSGIINNADKQCANVLFSQLPENEKTQILPYIFRKDSIEWLDSPQKEREYWSAKTMTEYDSLEYRKLLEYNPSGLLLYCYQQTEDNLPQSIELSMEVLTAVNNQIDQEQMATERDDSFAVEIIRRIDRVYYSDEWGIICLELLKKHYINHLTQGISLLFFKNPEKLVASISSDPEKYYLIKTSYCLPPQAYDNYDRFASFFDALMQMEERGVYLTGHIIGRAKCGADEIFPHEFAREYLEKQDSQVLDEAVFVGRFNSRGIRTVSDGTDERRNGELLLKQAGSIEVWYPHSARILRELAKDCFREAKRDQVYSEIEY